MVKRMILEFTTKEEAQDCIGAINSMAAQYWSEQGYTVIDGDDGKELVGKKNGVDNPDATRTITWDVVHESPDNTFYFSSLTGTPFEVGMESLSGAFSFAEKEFPALWAVDED